MDKMFPTLLVGAFLLQLASRGLAANLTEVQALHTAVFTGYNKKLLPVFNDDQTVNVSFDVDLVSINEFDELSGQLTATVIFYITWREERISWIPSDFGNKTSILVYAEDLWTPHVLTVNAADKIEILGNISIMARVDSNGMVSWNPGHVMKFICSVDITFYPFDEQICMLTFSSWSYNTEEVSLFSRKNSVSRSFYTNNSQWDLVDTFTISSEHGTNTNMSSFISFGLKLKRRSLFFLLYIIVPILFLATINSLIFLMPVTSGERTSVAITCFLSFVVFMTIINDNLPQSSSPMSYLYYYLLYLLFHSSTVIFLNIMSLRVYDKDGAVPRPISDIVKVLRCTCLWRRRKTKRLFPTERDTVNLGNETRSESDRLPSIKQRENDTTDFVTWRIVGKTFDIYCFILTTSACSGVSFFILGGLYMHADFIPTLSIE